MKKSCKSILSICTLVFIIGCKYPENNNEDIYNFMKIVLKDRKLNFSYGLNIKPESSSHLFKHDTIHKLSLIKTDTDSVKHIYLSNNNLLNLNLSTISKYFTQEDITEIQSQQASTKNFQWDNTKLRLEESNKNNWYSFSIPRFSEDKNKAIIIIKNLCPGLCGNYETILFIRKDNSWASNVLSSGFY